MNPIFAHTNPLSPNDCSTWETLEAHLQKTAELAEKFAADFDSAELAGTVARYHDVGKASAEFQKRLRGNATKVDHATAGARAIAEKIPNFGTLLAYAIAGHHAGLADGIGGDDSLSARLEKSVPEWKNAFLQNPELKKLLENIPANEKINSAIQEFFLNIKQEYDGFSIAFWIRMIFSSLVDADFLATEKFMSPEKSRSREAVPAPTIDALGTLLSEFLEKFQNPTSEIGKIRNEILYDCRERAKDKPGIFTLTVPTGGGKTLSSLAFALRHAREHGLRRVIYAIPFTSIIEQTADVFREAFDALGEDAVLEHHCNFVDERDNDAEYSRQKLLAENWDAPIVVTTNVQFFESLFSHKPSRTRKLHNLAKSVIILDEAQTIPLKFLRPCLRALKELAQKYGSTIVICTATQPALSSEKLLDCQLTGTEIIAPNRNLHERLRRVHVEKLAGTQTPTSLGERLARERQVLAIVNTKSDARATFEALQNSVPTNERANVFHLSTNLCAEHRTKIFEEIRKCLRENLPCRVVSTQLIEAGVDVDFPCVFRASAGIDSIAQAAGRCNREGKIENAGGRVFVFEMEKLPPPGFLRAAHDAGVEIAAQEKFARDLLSNDAVSAYFEAMYFKKGAGSAALDELRVLADLFPKKLQKPMLLKFRECGENFKLIEDAGTRSVIVPFDDNARELCEQLRAEFVPAERRKILQKLQRYSVNLYENKFQEARGNGQIELVHECVPVLVSTDLHYDKNLGLIFDGNADLPPY